MKAADPDLESRPVNPAASGIAAMMCRPHLRSTQAMQYRCQRHCKDIVPATRWCHRPRCVDSHHELERVLVARNPIREGLFKAIENCGAGADGTRADLHMEYAVGAALSFLRVCHGAVTGVPCDRFRCVCPRIRQSVDARAIRLGLNHSKFRSRFAHFDRATYLCASARLMVKNFAPPIITTSDGFAFLHRTKI